MNPTKECSCKKCVSACNWRPGWFMPGEMEEAAAFLNLSVEEFYLENITIDLLPFEDDLVFVPLPIFSKLFKIREINYGRCIFLDKNNLCKIHPVKPYECAIFDCKKTRTQKERQELKEYLLRCWQKESSYLTKLMGSAINKKIEERSKKGKKQ